MKLLLINPKFPESFWSFKLAVDKILPNKRTLNPPLGLATLAALSPPDWEIEIVDENIESIPVAPEADVVGICGMGVQFKRQRELLTFYRNQGNFVVAGGSYASLCPELYETLADTVVAGEAEYIWPEFCRDFLQGKPRKLYDETGVVELSDSPTPRFDLLKLDKYQAVSLQFSRGCPFRCEFCDIIVMFGRKPRTKTPEQVGRELDLLRQHGVRSAFFVDDNLIGHKPLAKDLLRYLRDYQQRHDYRFHFGTEASLNMAQDEELLQLFNQANFEWVFIGIESPDKDSLKETKKHQNLRQDILSSIRTIYSHGIDILAGFIIGFDNDTLKTFDRQYEFIQQAGISAAMIGLLTALPKTPLYERLQKDGRLIEGAENSDNTKLATNIIPRQMSYADMVKQYSALHYRLLEHRNIADRIKNKIRYLTNPLYDGNYGVENQLKILTNFITQALLPGGFSRLYYFMRSLPVLRPKLIPLVIEDWIIGLAMRDYVERHFVHEFEKVNQLAQRYLGAIEQAFQRYLRHDVLDVYLNQVKNTASNFSIHLKGHLDRAFFIRASHHLEKVLKDTTSSITLHIEEFPETRRKQLKKLLKRLSRYGDRISITVNEKVRHLVDIDSSVFHLVLER